DRRSRPGRRSGRRRSDEVGDVRPRLRQALARKPGSCRFSLSGPDRWDIVNGLPHRPPPHPPDPGDIVTGPPARPLTLQQIAAKRLSGQSWGQIFREMKAQGLVQEKSLSQVVSRYGQLADSDQGTAVTGAGRASALAGTPLDGASYGVRG